MVELIGSALSVRLRVVAIAGPEWQEAEWLVELALGAMLRRDL